MRVLKLGGCWLRDGLTTAYNGCGMLQNFTQSLGVWLIIWNYVRDGKWTRVDWHVLFKAGLLKTVARSLINHVKFSESTRGQNEEVWHSTGTELYQQFEQQSLPDFHITIVSGCWFNSNDSLCEETHRVWDQFLKCHLKTSLEGFIYNNNNIYYIILYNIYLLYY
jgi:hypothetical protein